MSFEQDVKQVLPAMRKLADKHRDQVVSLVAVHPKTGDCAIHVMAPGHADHEILAWAETLSQVMAKTIHATQCEHCAQKLAEPDRFVVPEPSLN